MFILFSKEASGPRISIILMGRTSIFEDQASQWQSKFLWAGCKKLRVHYRSCHRITFTLPDLNPLFCCSGWLWASDKWTAGVLRHFSSPWRWFHSTRASHATLHLTLSPTSVQAISDGHARYQAPPRPAPAKLCPVMDAVFL